MKPLPGYNPTEIVCKKSLQGSLIIRIIPNIAYGINSDYRKAVKNSGTTLKPELAQRWPRGLSLYAAGEQVYQVLLHERDQSDSRAGVYAAKHSMPDISMADGLQLPGFSGQMQPCQRGQSRSLRHAVLPNMHEHCHFYCDQCGGVFDIDFAADDRCAEVKLARGFQVTGYDVSIHGLVHVALQKRGADC